MKKFTTHVFILLTISLLSLSYSFLFAEQSLPDEAHKKQAIIIDYTIQNGDTLSGLTQKYLGDKTLWKLNADINPEIPNVNVLKPGSKIRLITGYKKLEPKVIAPQATVEVTSNIVNKSIQRGGWQDAAEGDELRPLDGVRTQTDSSAIIDFGDNSKVQLNELSAVFISKEEQENGLTRNEIEIEKGEAELKINHKNIPENERQNEFEIIIGEVRTTPSLDAQGQFNTKARLTDTESSQVMVYSGNSQVQSAGVSVSVDEGMGTIARSNEAPSPPEKLLLAPEISDQNTKQAAPDFVTLRWNTLENTDFYKFDLCRDKGCSQIFRALSGLKTNSLTLENLPEDQYYWRVAGVSPSGLDGYPSIAQALLIKKPPAPVIAPEPEQKLPWYVWALLFSYIIYFIWAYWTHEVK